MATINLDQLAGRRIFSKEGRCIGHLEEIVADADGNELIVAEYHVGIFAAFERLSASSIGTALLDLGRLRHRKGIYRIPWDKLDISDPTRPTLRCSTQELAALQSSASVKR
ncbi:hypothetical protein FJV76_13435 [Mesorhizobium sp. WSM4303]|uniref:hypothetical protein n=1 Tax=unclassified Mesorhizobium TaxID=325217 RepID=UPI00115DC75B|nr:MULTISPECIES: hypothetical protein [unclassified Mesorhizobium]TRC98317.1 hypothetical protein FJV77_07545 [Mesorhizobium sp. WSM4306]TRD04293.1 hypothetical protein FJV76_13435 [Mesorhizobium sp. WSM4303]